MTIDRRQARQTKGDARMAHLRVGSSGSEACSDLRTPACHSAASCDHQRAMPHGAPHPRSSDVSAVSRPSAPATAVSPSFPRGLCLQNAMVLEYSAVLPEAGCDSRDGNGWSLADFQEEGWGSEKKPGKGGGKERSDGWRERAEGAGCMSKSDVNDT